MTLPLTIVGGYLGAGKTTLVNHLLRHADGLRLAVLVNEFGALPIDAGLIEAQDDSIISIAGGCVCCSYGNDLTLALMDMRALDPAPDHVVLEASGVALPGAIAASVSLLDGYALDGVVVLADAETVGEQICDTYIGDTIERQLTDASLVILNKTDLVPDGTLETTRTMLRDRAAGAEVVAAQHGTVPPAVLLQSFLGRGRPFKAQPAHDAHLFRTVTLSAPDPVNAEMLAEGLAEAPLGLVRAKGFVTARDGTQNAIQVVGRRWAVTPAPPAAPLGLVAIGHSADLDPDALHALLDRAGLR